MNVIRLFGVLLLALGGTFGGPTYHQGFLTFSPETPASSYVCPGISERGGGIALNAVDFGQDKCGQCIQIVVPRQYAGNYKVVNVCTQCQEGDIDLCNMNGTGRHSLSWKYSQCR